MKYTDREKQELIRVLSVPIYPREGVDPAVVVAEYLLDNGYRKVEGGTESDVETLAKLLSVDMSGYNDAVHSDWEHELAEYLVSKGVTIKGE